MTPNKPVIASRGKKMYEISGCHTEATAFSFEVEANSQEEAEKKGYELADRQFHRSDTDSISLEAMEITT